MCIFCGGVCGGIGDALMPVILTLSVVLPGELKNKLHAWAEKRKKNCQLPENP